MLFCSDEKRVLAGKPDKGVLLAGRSRSGAYAEQALYENDQDYAEEDQAHLKEQREFFVASFRHDSKLA